MTDSKIDAKDKSAAAPCTCASPASTWTCAYCGRHACALEITTHVSHRGQGLACPGCYAEFERPGGFSPDRLDYAWAQLNYEKDGPGDICAYIPEPLVAKYPGEDIDALAEILLEGDPFWRYLYSRSDLWKRKDSHQLASTAGTFDPETAEFIKRLGHHLNKLPKSAQSWALLYLQDPGATETARAGRRELLLRWLKKKYPDPSTVADKYREVAEGSKYALTKKGEDAINTLGETSTRFLRCLQAGPLCAADLVDRALAAEAATTTDTMAADILQWLDRATARGYVTRGA
jgi:hypothetical protein